MVKYNKEEIVNFVSKYFENKNLPELYNDKCINYVGVTKDSKESYIKVIADYIIENILEFKNSFGNIQVTRNESYKIDTHTGISIFNFMEYIKNERREEKIAHSLFCQFYDEDSVLGKILDYQVPLKDSKLNSGLGKIDLLSYNKKENKTYLIELKKDNSKETLLRCILEAYTYSKIVDKEKLYKDFSLPLLDNLFVIAPLVYKKSDAITQVDILEPLIRKLEIPIEIFVFDYSRSKYSIEKIYN